MNKKDNTGLGLIKATIERAQNEKSLFNSALKKLVNSSEKELGDFLKRKIEETSKVRKAAEAKPSITRLISGSETIMIDALDGKKCISDAKQTFNAGIDKNFKDLGLNQPGPATAETLLDVSEMVDDGTFVQIFTDINSDIDRLVMSQSQIIRFCVKQYYRLLGFGYYNFFLTKVGGEYFVVSAYSTPQGLGARVNRLKDNLVWPGEDRCRIITPRLSKRVIEAEGNSLLRLVSEGQSLVIKALGKASPETAVQVHRLVRCGNFMDAFASLPGAWHEKCLTLDQAIEFRKSLSEWLTPRKLPTFILVKENEVIDAEDPGSNISVIAVYRNDILRWSLEHGATWDSDDGYSFVTRQLKP